ncbi:MAG TPA: hypothetical protein VH518_20550, partial [Tepidisphaeraceae bacterium]
MLSIILAAAQPGRSKLVFPGRDGKLVYPPDEQGNTIPDFSNCGYMGGGVKLPDVPVIKTLQPQSGGADDTQRIQAAVDELSKSQPDSHGIRGAVLLKRGSYRIGSYLRIRAGGVVLRGEGDDENGTILIGTGNKQRALINVSGEGNPRDVSGTTKLITDKLVPVGARQFNVENTAGLKVGQSIIVRRHGNAAWIHRLKMDQIPEKQGTKQWQPFDINYQRII